MSGVTKHIYNRDIIEIHKMWNRQLVTIEKILPKEYSGSIIIEILKKYYPHEWDSVNLKKEYYDIKDRYIKKHTGKLRYNMPNAEKLIRKNIKYKLLVSNKKREEHKFKFDDKIRWENEKELLRKREKKIKQINTKIEKAKSKTQIVTPVFLHELINLYNQKETTQKDRMYIIRELKKYYNNDVVCFFFKVNDTEINRQLREEAFYHLQSFCYEPRLRKQKYILIHTKNKKKKKYLKNVYAKLKYTIPQNPQELEYRIENGPEQGIKVFDYFISHSSKDSKIVQNIIKYENSIGVSIFCDWINDSDYLKRHLVCQSTKNVIKWRLDQSKALIFVRTSNSLKSIWCRFELEYFWGLKKPIFVIDEEEIKKGNYELIAFDKKFFEDFKIDNMDFF